MAWPLSVSQVLICSYIYTHSRRITVKRAIAGLWAVRSLDCSHLAWRCTSPRTLELPSGFYPDERRLSWGRASTPSEVHPAAHALPLEVRHRGDAPRVQRKPGYLAAHSAVLRGQSGISTRVLGVFGISQCGESALRKVSTRNYLVGRATAAEAARTAAADAQDRCR